MPIPDPHPLRRLLRGAAAIGATAALAAGALTAAAPAALAADAVPPASDDLASRFSIAMLPDTQFYSRYSSDQFIPRYGKDPFTVQAEWLRDNRDTYKIAMTSQLGDIVDRQGVQREWQAADNAVRVLDDAKMPYAIAPGNHDVRNSDDRLDDTDYDLSAEPFLKWFGPQRAAGVSTYGGSDATGMSQYQVFEAEGQKYLLFALSWRISPATVDWVQSVLDANPTMPAILTSHSILNIAPDAESPLETEYGLELWDALIRKNDQIFLTVNGHFHGASSQVKKNDFGNDVAQVVMDYQMAHDGGNGYLGMFEFDLTNGELNLETVSPWVRFKPQDSLTVWDQPVLTGRQQQFSVPMDFAKRFAGFNPSFTAGAATTPSLSERVRTDMLNGFEGPDPVTTELPGNEKDFVEVPGTLAHWRFNKLDGTVGADAVVEDVAGDNDLRRVDPAQTNAVGATWEDVSVEKTNVPGYSSDGAAACFSGADQNADDANTTDGKRGRFSYLSTAADAAVNNADLSRGYTIETFVKMDSSWDAAKNGWSKFLTRTGNRETLPGMPWSQWDRTASPSALGISNLREFQWTSVDNTPRKGDRTNWSGEIQTEQWTHVAIVNDASKAVTTMYVNGAPVLRNATDVAGMSANAGMPWILGADWVDNAARNGWNGCIGETRIIDRPTTPDQWLTQRADLTGLTVDEAPKGTLPVGTDTVRLAGTGFPGAEVRVSGLGEATTEVAADGTWAIDATGLTAGAYTAKVSQALGTRAAEPVPVSFEIEPFALDLTASTRTIAGKKYVSVLATNKNATPVNITIETAYGTKTFDAVRPGASANVSINTRATSIPAGEVTVTVSAIVDGELITMSKKSAYAAS